MSSVVDRAQIRRDGEVLLELADSDEAFVWFICSYNHSSTYAVAFDGYSVTDGNGRTLPDWSDEAMHLDHYRATLERPDR